MLYGVLWVLYSMNTPLLVVTYITYTHKWAAQCNAPLRSGTRTKMGGFIYCIDFIRRKYNKVNKNICMGFDFV